MELQCVICKRLFSVLELPTKDPIKFTCPRADCKAILNVEVLFPHVLNGVYEISQWNPPAVVAPPMYVEDYC